MYSCKSFFLTIFMKVDCIIVGFGLAGLSFAKALEDNHKSFVVFENNSQTSSHVAGGVYNPVILKRFTPVWQGQEQLNIALPFYKELETKFSKQYDYKFSTFRVFKSIEEQNNWFASSDKPLLEPFMDTNLIHKQYDGISSDYGFGRLKHTGRIDTKALIEDYKAYLESNNILYNDSFNHDLIQIFEEGVRYDSIEADHIVFCEGFGLHNNKFFNELPMNEAKGELLTIHAPDLNVDFLIKSAVFVLPMGNDYYKVGATFNWHDKTINATEEGRNELIEKLDSFISVPYDIVDQTAGIRPTVKDRRPLVGVHKEFKQLSILNGLGTRGVMIGPKVANELYGHLFEGKPLDTESDIKRFYK